MARKRTGFGNRYCVYCGRPVEKNTPQCPSCGCPYDEDAAFAGVPVYGAGGIGWSAYSGHPCFKRRSSKNIIGFLITMILVSGGIFAAIYFTSDMELGEMLPIFGGVMALIWTFWLFWLIVQFAKRKDWEGVVESKECRVQEHTRRDSDGESYTETQTVYKIHFRLSDGKRKTLTAIDHSGWYDYLHEGEHVRYHGKNMNYYEKYDKTRDAMIPCAACGASRDARENYCGRCGAIMLKGQPSAQPQYPPTR